jgi:hypothetical protein
LPSSYGLFGVEWLRLKREAPVTVLGAGAVLDRAFWESERRPAAGNEPNEPKKADDGKKDDDALTRDDFDAGHARDGSAPRDSVFGGESAAVGRRVRHRLH